MSDSSNQSVPEKAGSKLRGKNILKYVQIPSSIFFDERIDGISLLVWIALKSHTNKNKNVVWPTNERIGELARCNEKTARIKLEILKKYGYVSFIGKIGRSSKWEVIANPKYDNSDPIPPFNISGSDDRNISGASSVNNGQDYRLSNNKEVEQNKVEDQLATSTDILNQRWERLWTKLNEKGLTITHEMIDKDKFAGENLAWIFKNDDAYIDEILDSHYMEFIIKSDHPLAYLKKALENGIGYDRQVGR